MSIFDIEEKLIKEIDGAYLISNGWKLEYATHSGWVYIKTIHQKNRPKRFIRFCYHHDTFPKRTLRNLNTWETIEVHDIMAFELQIKEWQTNWEADWENIYKQYI